MFDVNIRVPFGKIENTDASDSYLFVRWAPGNGMAYTIVATYAGQIAGGYLGGDMQISLMVDGMFVSQFFPFESMLFHESLIEEHYFKGKEYLTTDILLYTILVNSVFGGFDYVKEIATRETLARFASR